MYDPLGVNRGGPEMTFGVTLYAELTQERRPGVPWTMAEGDELSKSWVVRPAYPSSRSSLSTLSLHSVSVPLLARSLPG